MDPPGASGLGSQKVGQHPNSQGQDHRARRHRCRPPKGPSICASGFRALRISIFSVYGSGIRGSLLAGV